MSAQEIADKGVADNQTVNFSRGEILLRQADSTASTGGVESLLGCMFLFRDEIEDHSNEDSGEEQCIPPVQFAEQNPDESSQ